MYSISHELCSILVTSPVWIPSALLSLLSGDSFLSSGQSVGPLSHAQLFPVLHQTAELAQTHVHWVGDAIQPSQPLSSPSPPHFNLSVFQGLFQWVSSSHQVAKVLKLQLQHQSFQWVFRVDWLTGLISLQSKGLSRVFSSTTVQKHQFLGAQPSLWSNSHIRTCLLEKPWLLLYAPLSAKWCLCFLIYCLGFS